MSKTRKIPTAGPASRAAAYVRQQAEMAERKADTRRRMAESRDAALAAGDDDLAAFWSDYLDDLG